VGDAQGRIRQWFMIRGELGHRLEPIRDFDIGAPVQRIIPEPRRKGFAAVGADDRCTCSTPPPQRTWPAIHWPAATSSRPASRRAPTCCSPPRRTAACRATC
jgi:hypothetical protein